VTTPSVSELSAVFRARACALEPFAAPAAVAFREAASLLEAALAAAEDELLTPRQAAEVTGLSARTLRDHRARGLLEDRGTSGRPKYRRGDLPRRGRQEGPGGWNPDAHVVDIVGRS
jgi:hypothetical protein